MPQGFFINPANQTITFGTLANHTWGEPDFTVSALASSGLAVTFTAAGDATVTSGGLVHITGAGSATIFAHQAGDTNYRPAFDVPQGFFINPANQTITFGTLANHTWGDPDFTVSATATSRLPVDFTATGSAAVYENTGTGVWYVHIGGAGSATITAQQGGDDNYHSAADVPQGFTIGQANASITVTGFSGTYDGAAHGVTSSSATGVESTPADLTSLLHLSYVNQATRSSSTSAPVDAGTYEVFYTFEGNGDYNAVTTSTDTGTQVVIGQAKASISVMGFTGPYDRAAHGVISQLARGVKGEDLSNLLLVAATTYSDAPGGQVHWTFDGNADYNAASGDATVTINKVKAVIVVTPYTSAGTTYDGMAHTAAITSITGVNGETGATVGTVDVSKTAHTDAGTYAGDAWSFTGAGNYNDISSTTITDSIARADAAIVINGYSHAYDGLYHGATLVSATGANNEDLTASVTLGGETYKDVPGGLASWSFANGNYNAQSSSSVAIDITPADAVIVVTPYTSGTTTYDGNAHTAAITSITGVNGETGAVVGTVTLNTSHTSAGTYASDSWSFAGTANYNIASTTITDTINKATLTITANNASKVDGTLTTFSSTAFTATGLANGDTLPGVTETSTGAAAAAAAGTYTIVPSAATGTGLDNYTIKYVNGTLTVLTPNAAYVDQLYHQLLNRIPDPGGLAGWVAALDNGVLSRTQVAQAILNSDEYRQDVIENLYEHYLHRAAEAAGLAGWMQGMRNGLTDAQLEAAFVGSPEYLADQKAGPGNWAPWVTSLYQDLFSRTPSGTEVSGWVTGLNAGITPGYVAYGFTASAERATDGVRADYQQYLGRTPGAAEMAGWVRALEQGAHNEFVIAGLLGSPEYFQNITGVATDRFFSA